MKIKKTKFIDIFKIYFKKNKDNRGFLARDFCKKEFKKRSINFEVKQTNLSFNKNKGTFRGFHYQAKPYSEKKIINCLKGEIILFILDIDLNSKNYLKWIRLNLKENDGCSVFVSNNYATGFLTLKKNTTVFYYMSQYFKTNKGKGINLNDPKIKIKLPFKPKIISTRDKNFKFLK